MHNRAAGVGVTPPGVARQRLGVLPPCDVQMYIRRVVPRISTRTGPEVRQTREVTRVTVGVAAEARRRIAISKASGRPVSLVADKPIQFPEENEENLYNTIGCLLARVVQ